jgi:hypothetical protein
MRPWSLLFFGDPRNRRESRASYYSLSFVADKIGPYSDP